MKQRITLEQLNQLTESQKQKLRELWKPNKHDIVVTIDNYEVSIWDCTEDEEVVILNKVDECEGWYIEITKKDCIPLLSIGQMIELLINKGRFSEKIIIEIFQATKVEKENKICEIYEHSRDYEDGIVSYANKELVDCLWDAVKEVL